MSRYITIPKFAELSGYTAAAIRTKIRDSFWPENQVWRKAPDGRILIDMKGYEQWVEHGLESEQLLKLASRSPSSTRGGAAGKKSLLSPRPLT